MIVAAAAIALAGCGGDADSDLPAIGPNQSAGSDDGDGTSAASPASTAPAEVDDAGDVKLALEQDPPEEKQARAVYDAYVAFWTADLKALADPSKGNGKVADLAVDPQRRRTLADIASMRAAKTRSKGTMTIAPVPGVIESKSAQLSDCLDDTALQTVDAKGTKVPDTEGKRVQLVVTLKRVDDAWVVANIAGSGGTC